MRRRKSTFLAQSARGVTCLATRFLRGIPYLVFAPSLAASLSALFLGPLFLSVPAGPP